MCIKFDINDNCTVEIALLVVEIVINLFIEHIKLELLCLFSIKLQTILVILFFSVFSISLDSPISQLLHSDFRLMDEQRTRSVTIRDLLSHRTGVPGYFHALLVGLPAQVTREQLLGYTPCWKNSIFSLTFFLLLFHHRCLFLERKENVSILRLAFPHAIGNFK